MRHSSNTCATSSEFPHSVGRPRWTSSTKKSSIVSPFSPHSQPLAYDYPVALRSGHDQAQTSQTLSQDIRAAERQPEYNEASHLATQDVPMDDMQPVATDDPTTAMVVEATTGAEVKDSPLVVYMRRLTVCRPRIP